MSSSGSMLFVWKTEELQQFTVSPLPQPGSHLADTDGRLLGIPDTAGGAPVDVLPEQSQQAVALVAVIASDGSHLELFRQLPRDREDVRFLPRAPL